MIVQPNGNFPVVLTLSLIKDSVFVNLYFFEWIVCE